MAKYNSWEIIILIEKFNQTKKHHEQKVYTKRRKLGTEILHQSTSILSEMLVESTQKTMSECFSYLYQQTYQTYLQRWWDK